MWVSVKDQTKTIKINTDFIVLLDQDESSLMLSSGTIIALSPEDYQDVELTMFPKRKAVAKDDVELATYLNYLHKLTGGKSLSILTPQRKKKLQDLLKSMTKEQLEVAAANIGKDPWLQGENEKKKRWGDIDYLLRPDKAARWAEYKAEQKKMF